MYEVSAFLDAAHVGTAHTWQVGQADNDDHVEQEDVGHVDTNAQPHPPVLVLHIQASQDAVS